MTVPLLATKLYLAPPRANLVPRPRLMERLSAGLSRKLTLVSAPPGFGKTTLLSDWFASLRAADEGGRHPRLAQPNGAHPKPQVCCLSLDQADNDPTRFWIYFAAAVQTARPEAGEICLQLLQAPQPPSAEIVLTTLVNKISEKPDSLVVVIDDLHLIHTAAIHETLIFLLDHLPPQMHLVAVTRAEPPWPLARWRARDQLVELRAADLRFTPEEAAAFLNQVMKLGLTPEEVTALENRTEGWIAGLQMAALALQGALAQPRQDEARQFISAFTGSHRYIFDYLVEEVLQQQPPAIQDFLLNTSILERLSAPLCDAVLADSAGAGVDSQSPATSATASLAYLERGNLFIVPLDAEQHWYRYHHLFADLLRRRLEQSRPASLPDLHRRASLWFENNSFFEEAVAHAFASGDQARAADLVSRYSRHVYLQTNLATLSGWLRALPEDVVRGHPWLSVYQALVRYWRGPREQIEEYLQAAEQALAQAAPAAQNLPEDEQQYLAGNIATIRAHYALVRGDLPRVLAMAQRALNLLPPNDYLRGWTAVALGGAYWGQGDVQAAQAAFATARVVALQHGYRFLAISPACYVGMQLAKQGLLDDALHTYQEALEYGTVPGGQQFPMAGFANVKIADVLRERNDLDAADRYLRQGVAQCVQLGHPDVLADAYACLARLQIVQADLPGAQATLQKASDLEQESPVDPFVRCWLDEARVRLWLAGGDLKAALRWAEASGLQVDGELNYHYDLHHLNLARVLVAQGLETGSKPGLGEAIGLLARLLAAAEKAGWVNEAIKSLALQAVAYKALGDRPAAGEALAHAIRLAEPGGYLRIFVDEGEPMRSLVADFRRRDGGDTPQRCTYVAKLLAAFPSTGTASPIAQALIEPLSERELEVMRLLNAGLTSPEIAQKLYISVSTVRTHIKNIYSKLGASRRIEAIQRATELKLI